MVVGGTSIIVWFIIPFVLFFLEADSSTVIIEVELEPSVNRLHLGLVYQSVHSVDVTRRLFGCLFKNKAVPLSSEYSKETFLFSPCLLFAGR